MSIQVFDTVDGQPVHEVILRNATGAQANILTWGAIVRDLQVPLADGRLQRVVLGFETLANYRQYSPYFGAIAGRYANRIAGGTFELDGRRIELDRNQMGRHTLHGGTTSFGKRPWTLLAHSPDSVTLSLVSDDGDMGFPGRLIVTCAYRLLAPATLQVDLTATCDTPTVCNLAHHSYFNLDGSPDIGEHVLSIDGDVYTPVDADLIPTGEMLAVAGTPHDFRSERPIRFTGRDGERVRYDHNWMLRHRRDRLAQTLHRAAHLRSLRNGLALSVFTNEPAVQFYDAHKVSIPVAGLGGATYGAFAGLCLEPQIAPDSPNRAWFHDPVLRPGEAYRQVTEYRFVS